MKYIIFLTIIISGCTNLKNANKKAAIMSKGLWVGKIEQITTKELPDKNSEKNYELVFMNCNSIPEFWVKIDNSKYITAKLNYKVESKLGNILFYNISNAKGWVETQSWAIVSIDENTASLQWNRMVSNLNLRPEEELRSFGQLGHGVIKKVSNKCNFEEIKN